MTNENVEKKKERKHQEVVDFPVTQVTHAYRKIN